MKHVRTFWMEVLMEAGLLPWVEGVGEAPGSAWGEAGMVEQWVEEGRLMWSQVGAAIEAEYGVQWEKTGLRLPLVSEQKEWMHAVVEAGGVPLLDGKGGDWAAVMHPDAMLELMQLDRAVEITFVRASQWKCLIREWDEGVKSDAVEEGGNAQGFLGGWWARMLREGASDFHLEPEIDGWVVRLRCKGRLRLCGRVDRVEGEKWIQQVCHRSSIAFDQAGEPKDGLFQGGADGGQGRVSIIPALHGPSVVIRQRHTGEAPEDLAGLGLKAESLSRLQDVLSRGQGMVLVVGPTGSGKSTTVELCLKSFDGRDKKILTVEDPVETHLADACQVEVREGSDMDFAEALKAFLRQAPDVVMVGEIRDAGTARLAVRAALGGHLILSTLHAPNPQVAMLRLQGFGIGREVLNSTLKAVISQRLVVEEKSGRIRRRLETECWFGGEPGLS